VGVAGSGYPARVTIPFPAGHDAARFFETLPYHPSAFLVDEVLAIDVPAKTVKARLHTTKALPFTDAQRGDPGLHPRHVSGSILVHLTGMLGSVHAWFIHGLRFDEGWVGFGSRIHRADFKRLARVGPPLELTSVETNVREGPTRQVVRYEFRFEQEGEVCYLGDQTAIWVKGRDLTEE
jgi:hypothetical protein